jgi:hypothetical protein
MEVFMSTDEHLQRAVLEELDWAARGSTHIDNELGILEVQFE